MRLSGILLVCVLFVISCKTDKQTKANTSGQSIEAAVKTTDSKMITEKELPEVILEEKYAELKKEEPAIDPSEKPNTKTQVDLKNQAPKQTPTDPQAITQAPKQKVKETKVQNTNTSTSKPPTEKVVSTKIVSEPVPIPEETVEKVEVKEPQKPAKTKKPQPAKLLHAPFSKLLSTQVSPAGKVNYKGIQGNINELDDYLAALESADLGTMSKNEKLAFWINAYNAFTIKKILNNYPLASITDLDGGKPWDTKWINLDGKSLSLNNIENDIIRPKYKEPRIHFAVNCAAKSCPPLMNKAWTAENLDADFERQTKAFVNNSAHNELSANSCTVSKIFEWYAVDFSDLVAFLNKYSTTTIEAGVKPSYKEYDWSLNQ